MTTILSRKNLMFHYILTLIIALTCILYNEIRNSIPILPGLLAIGSFILYYDLTNLYDRKFAIINFILNFVLIQIESLLFITIEQDNMYQVLFFILVLFATNKIVIDILFFKFGKIPKAKSRIDTIITHYKDTGKFKYK